MVDFTIVDVEYRRIGEFLDRRYLIALDGGSRPTDDEIRRLNASLDELAAALPGYELRPFHRENIMGEECLSTGKLKYSDHSSIPKLNVSIEVFPNVETIEWRHLWVVPIKGREYRKLPTSPRLSR